MKECDETWKPGGIIVRTDNAKEPPPEGEVVSVGPDVKEIRQKDWIIYGKFAAQKVGDEVLICEDDVLAIREKDDGTR